MSESKLDVEWFCTFCNQLTTTRYGTVDTPVCYTCDAEATWEIILTNSWRVELNKIIEQERSI